MSGPRASGKRAFGEFCAKPWLKSGCNYEDGFCCCEVRSIVRWSPQTRYSTYRVQTIGKVGRVRVQTTVVNAGEKNSSVATLGLISIPRAQRRAWALERER
jgi:hypothetical protein